jgi:hypothetical protein
MRPDEEAAEVEITRDRKNRSILSTVAKSAGASAAAGLAARVMPLLSDFVPTDFAVNAISKIAPQLGSFLKKGKNAGLDLREGLNYLRDNVFSEQDKDQVKTQADSKNIVQRYSPELHQYIVEQIGRGRSALEAGALATLEKSHASSIKKIVADAKIPWSEIVEASYGGTGSMPTPGTSKQEMSPQVVVNGDMKGGVAKGSGQQALAEILAKINARLGQQ